MFLFEIPIKQILHTRSLDFEHGLLTARRERHVYAPALQSCQQVHNTRQWLTFFEQVCLEFFLLFQELLVRYGKLRPLMEDLACLRARATLELCFYGPWQGRAAVAFEDCVCYNAVEVFGVD
jgi:hypothetical protein